MPNMMQMEKELVELRTSTSYLTKKVASLEKDLSGAYRTIDTIQSELEGARKALVFVAAFKDMLIDE